METISVRNESGQVAHFDVTGPDDQRAKILRQRIGSGELTLVDADAESGPPDAAPPNPDDFRYDEKGDVLSSVHGGGRDEETALVEPATTGEADAPPVEPVMPPRNGAGSGRDKWAEYAEALEVAVPEDAARDDIIALLDAAGYATDTAE